MTDLPPTPLRSPEQLIAALRDGITAYEQLVRLYQPYLIRIARQEISREVEVLLGASGVVQETWCKVWQAFRDFRGHTEAELLSWMRHILHNVVGGQERKLHAHKRDVRRQEPLTPSSSHGAQPKQRLPEYPSPSSLAGQQEELDRLHQALSRLPLKARLVVLLQKEHGLADEQIGELLGCSRGAVRMKRARALARLRQELGGNDVQ